MPRTKPDSDFTDALKRFVADECGGRKALAAAKLGIPRQHVGQYLQGSVPLRGRKRECLAVMAKAGYFPGAGLGGDAESVTFVTKTVTENVDPPAVAAMLRFLLELVERSSQVQASPPPQGQEGRQWSE